MLWDQRLNRLQLRHLNVLTVIVIDLIRRHSSLLGNLPTFHQTVEYMAMKYMDIWTEKLILPFFAL